MKRIIVSACLMLAVMLASCGPPDAPYNKPVTEQPQAVIAVRSEDLYRTYMNNEVAADVKYKGQVIQITGLVSYVSKLSKQTQDSAFIVGLSVSADNGQIVCGFPASQEASVAELNPVDLVVIQSICAGQIILPGNPPSRNIVLYNSKLISKESPLKGIK